MIRADEIPRRSDLTRNTAAELTIRQAMLAVEEMAADVRLTDAVNLLHAARESVADFTDGVDVRRYVQIGSAAETGWLVERAKSSGGPSWWTGSGFSTDSLKAVRFVRKVDAEQVMKALRWEGKLIATEHEWVPVPTAEIADLAEDRHFAGED